LPADDERLPEWWRWNSPRLRGAVAIIWVAVQLAVVRRTGWLPVVAAVCFLLYSLVPLLNRRR